MMIAAEAYYRTLNDIEKRSVDLALSIIEQAVERGETTAELRDDEQFCCWELLKHWDHVLILLGYKIDPIRNAEEYSDIVGYKISW